MTEEVEMVGFIDEPLAPVNDLVTTFDDLAIQNENDTIALLLILAEID